MVQDPLNFYLLSWRIAFEQVFDMLVSRIGISWSPLQYNLAKDTLILMAACKLHNFIIESDDLPCCNNLKLAAENNVNGTLLVHLQDSLYL